MGHGDTLVQNLIDNSGARVNRSHNIIARRRGGTGASTHVIDNRDAGVNQATNIIYSRGKEIHNHNYITNVYQCPSPAPSPCPPWVAAQACLPSWCPPIACWCPPPLCLPPPPPCFPPPPFPCDPLLAMLVALAYSGVR